MLSKGVPTVDFMLEGQIYVQGTNALSCGIGFNPELSHFGSLPVVPQLVTGTLPTMLPVATHQIGSIALMPAQAVTQQATRHARRVYVGGLPPMANEQTIATFFSHVMSAIGGNAAGPGDAVVNVYINHEKKFAFVEMRSVEEASNAMALDGIIFEGVPVKVRRPTDYNPSLAATLGPSQPSPHLNLAAVGLLPSAIGGSEGPDRVFVGGLPYYFTDAQIRELLESFGPLRGFDLVKDRDTGNSKGYGFCVYQDPSVTDIACAALNGLKMGEKTLTVRRATASMGQMKPEQELILQQAHEHIAIQKLALQSGGASHFQGFALNAIISAEPPTKVVCLTEVVSVDELRDEEVYKEILEDMREESEKFGSLINLVIPRPGPTGEAISGVGKVFLEYANVTDSARAKVSLHGRRFGENVVSATYYSEEKFATGDYDAMVVA
ncbi:splicing factor U2af large subunit B-like isoform X4 [Musa acuminata AAA Group]|uniref:splicing factor U2af large subunit B-like isoform X4 n=1 Tax=Musa acuminata AAA Group TaxID=214697 RepID=UPI0031D829D7